jgi:hypothetical protein
MDHFNNDEAPPYKTSVNGNKLNSSLLYKLEVVTLKTEAVNKSTQSEDWHKSYHCNGKKANTQHKKWAYYTT